MAQQFIAIGVDQNGQKISGLTTKWELVYGGGTITAGGLFTAGNKGGEYPGTVKVTVSQGSSSKAVTARVIIEDDRLMFEQTRLDGRVELFRLNLDGTNLTRIIEFNSSITVPTTSWSPDGKRIAYESCTSNGCSIVVMNDEGQWRIPIVGGTTPAFSPDGTRLALSRISGTTAAAQQAAGASELYVVDLDGGNLKRLTNQIGIELYPSWSPDGQNIAFEVFKSGVSDIYTVKADGTNLKLLQSNAEKASWSPDGKEILFESDREGFYAIHVMNADGSNVRRLTPAISHSFCADWSLDGKQIIFGSQGGSSNYEIYKADRFGNNVVRLSNTNSQLSINRNLHHVCPRFAPRKTGKSISVDTVVVKSKAPAAQYTQATLAEKVKNSVVRIEVTTPDGKGVGSGFAIDSNGLIMTANHVIVDSQKIEVKVNDGTIYQATVQKRDSARDIALIKINADLPALPMGDEGWLDVGTEVGLFGFPGGVQNLVTSSGYVSAFLTNEAVGITYLETDAKSAPGGSGGPMVTLSGHVAGMLTLGRTGIATLDRAFMISNTTLKDFLSK